MIIRAMSPRPQDRSLQPLGRTFSLGVQDLCELLAAFCPLMLMHRVQSGLIDLIIDVQTMPSLSQFDRRIGQVLSPVSVCRSVHESTFYKVIL
jgi:hypothetical protein